MSKKNNPIVIGGVSVAAGERRNIDLPLPPLYTHTSVSMPAHVVNGRSSGPVLCVIATIHGDEINGIEIIRRLLKQKSLNRIKGTLIAVPVVNVYGFVSQSRYLPDRRDLNRSFPGSERGTMASRLADTLMTEIIEHSTHCIDLHTAAVGRANLPQIRVDLDANPELLELAQAFSPPVVLDSSSRAGTLRAAASDKPLLLYEAGEALRFDELAIRAGLKGIVKVMRHLGMLPALRTPEKKRYEPMIANESVWMRAPQSGILRTLLELGAVVKEGDVLGVIADPFGDSEEKVLSSATGLLVGYTKMPLVHEGEALFHVACMSGTKSVARAVDGFHLEYDQTHLTPNS